MIFVKRYKYSMNLFTVFPVQVPYVIYYITYGLDYMVSSHMNDHISHPGAAFFIM